jgi:hypothetical protein
MAYTSGTRLVCSSAVPSRRILSRIGCADKATKRQSDKAIKQESDEVTKHGWKEPINTDLRPSFDHILSPYPEDKLDDDQTGDRK